MAMAEFDPDEDFVKSDQVGDIITPSGNPWELPRFSLEDARAIGAIAGELIESGEWEKVERRIILIVGSNRGDGAAD